MTEKKYFWLKLKEDFFKDLKIKKLRKIAGGDTYTIIYLKIQLLSLSNGGLLVYENIEPSFEEEIALQIDEDIENVKITLNYLISVGMLEELDKNNFLLPQTVECIGKEGATAERVRKHRQKVKMLQCNTDVTKCNTEIEKEKDKEIDVCVCQRGKKFKDETCKDCWYYRKQCKLPFYNQPRIDKQVVEIETEDVKSLETFFNKN